MKTGNGFVSSPQPSSALFQKWRLKTMKRLVVSALALFLLVCAIGANWPVAVKVGDSLVLTAEAGSTWSILPKSWNRIVYPNTGEVAFDTSKPGVIGIALTNSDGVLLTHHQIIVGSGEPQPNPNPEPEPNPEPQPEPNPIEKLYGMVLYETNEVDDLGPGMAQVILGVRLRKLDEDFEWNPFDLDSVDAEGEVPKDIAPWLALIAEKDLEIPQLFLIDQDGKLVDNRKLPESVDEVITLVREHLPEGE
jgi:hypothetical protein